MARYYNPGFPISEKLTFDNPTTDWREGSIVSYHDFKVGREEFVEVPETMTLNTPAGQFVVPVDFKGQLTRTHEMRGLTLVTDGDDNAKAHAKEVWRTFLAEKGHEWYEIVAATKAQGLLPKPAFGFWKAVLNELNLADPADIVGNNTQALADGKNMEALLQKMGAMQAKLEALEKRKVHA